MQDELDDFEAIKIELKNENNRYKCENENLKTRIKNQDQKNIQEENSKINEIVINYKKEISELKTINLELSFRLKCKKLDLFNYILLNLFSNKYIKNNYF